MAKSWNIPDEALEKVATTLTAMAERGNTEAAKLLVKLHGQLERNTDARANPKANRLHAVRG